MNIFLFFLVATNTIFIRALSLSLYSFFISRNNQKLLFKPARLTARSVYADFMKIATTSGQSSQTTKVGMAKKLLVACMGNEAKYLVRGLQGKLRIGLAEQSVLIALAQAVAITPPSSTLPLAIPDIRKTKGMTPEKASNLINEAVTDIKQAFSEAPSFDRLISVMIQHGVAGLKEHCTLQPGIPVKPMLGAPHYFVF